MSMSLTRLCKRFSRERGVSLLQSDYDMVICVVEQNMFHDWLTRQRIYAILMVDQGFGRCDRSFGLSPASRIEPFRSI